MTTSKELNYLFNHRLMVDDDTKFLYRPQIVLVLSPYH